MNCFQCNRQTDSERYCKRCDMFTDQDLPEPKHINADVQREMIRSLKPNISDDIRYLMACAMVELVKAFLRDPKDMEKRYGTHLTSIVRRQNHIQSSE